jgi:hypothetical protein
LLFDTDVIIDYLRDQSDVVQYLENLSEILLISSIVVAELYSGLRDEPEREALENFLKAFEIVPVNREIAIRGGTYRRDYNKSHGTGLADALIAATADIRQAKLVTLNKKHFPMLENVITPYQKT